MRKLMLTVPQVGLFTGTRAMAALGIGLLLADRLDRSQRRAVGITLLAVGAVTTIPLAMEMVAAVRQARRREERIEERRQEAVPA